MTSPRPVIPYWTPDFRGIKPDYKIDIKTDLPPVGVLRAESGQGSVTVNDNALKQYADIVERLIPHIEEAKRRLSMVSVRPGNFVDADNIVAKVGTQSSDGLTKIYLEHLTNLRAAVTDVAKRMRQLADKYGKTESANTITGEDVRALVEDMQADFSVPGVTNAPNGQPTIPTPPVTPGQTATPGQPATPVNQPDPPPTAKPGPHPNSTSVTGQGGSRPGQGRA